MSSLSDAPERILLEKSANLVVVSTDLGLRPLPGAGLRRVLLRGFGDESLGGRLTVTNRRVLFGAHAANRAAANLDIPLGELTSVDNVSAGIARMMRLAVPAGPHVFVVWGVPAVIDAIESARTSG